MKHLTVFQATGIFIKNKTDMFNFVATNIDDVNIAGLKFRSAAFFKR
jgi:hypothetical protein